MGRNDNTWSDRHRSAIGYAQTEQGMTSSEAVAAAKRGELGLPAFDMPASTAREIAQSYSRGELEAPDIEDEAKQLARRLQDEINKWAGQLLEDNNVSRDHWKYKQLCGMQVAVLSVLRKDRPPNRRHPTKTTETDAQTTPELLASLLHQTDQDGDGDSEPGS